MDEGRVPWSLTGFLLVNLREAMCLAAVMNPNLNLEQRLENALTGFVLLDLCALVAEQRSKDHGVSKDLFWIAKQTQRNLQELCACCALQSMGPMRHGVRPSSSWNSTLAIFVVNSRTASSEHGTIYMHQQKSRTRLC